MRSIIMIGIMHFMDTSNMDLNRTKRCGIHYAVPDGRIISFCTYNSIHRPMVEKKFAIKPKEWRSKHNGARLNEPV